MVRYRKCDQVRYGVWVTWTDGISGWAWAMSDDGVPTSSHVHGANTFYTYRRDALKMARHWRAMNWVESAKPTKVTLPCG